jgi:WD40 repeat protein
MAISPDGSTLAIGSFSTDGLVTLWSLPTVSWQQSACAMANRDLTPQEIEKYFDNAPYREICPIAR